MASQSSQGLGPAESPSASSVFLPLGRRGSRASLSTEAERESLNAALDKIHTAAYQSDSLTVFNDFTSPPVPTAANDDKGQQGDLQGGLSGLYSRLRVSVGGVRDMVSSGGKSLDKPAAESAANKITGGKQTVAKVFVAPTSSETELAQSLSNPKVESRIQSPTAVSFQASQDSLNQLNPGKTSKLSSKATSVSSKASMSPSPALRSPVAPLHKTSGSLSVADPTVTEVHVTALRDDGTRSRHGSVNLASGFSDIDNGGAQGESGSVDLSLDSSSISQRHAQSPILQAKSLRSSISDAPSASDASRLSVSGPPSVERSRRPGLRDQQVLNELDSSVPNAPRKVQQDLPLINSSEAPSGSNSSSTPSLGQNDPSMPSSATNSSTRISNESSYHEGQPPTTAATSVSLNEREPAQLPPTKKTAQSRPKDNLLSRVSQSRLPGFSLSRASSTETATTNSAITPLNTAISRVTSLETQRPPAPGDDIVMSHLRSKLLSKDFWMRDENAKDCFHCGEPFSTFRRKHHCRTCGQIFDSKCTFLIPGVRFGQPGTIRVCKPCEAMINAHDDDSSDYSDGEQSPIVVNPRISDLNVNGTHRASFDDDDTVSVKSQSLDHVLKTPTMAIPATRRAIDGQNRRSTILEINPERSLARPTSSRSLKSSIIGRTHSMGHKRHHSRQQYIRNFKSYHDERAPFQRRPVEDANYHSRLPAFHKDSIIDPDLAQYLSDDASSGDDQPNLMAIAESSLPKNSGESERATFGGLLAAMKKGRSVLGDKSILGREGDDGSVASSRAVNLPRPSRRRNLSVASSVHQRQSPRASKDGVFHISDVPNPVFEIPPAVTSTAFKMMRSSSMRGQGTSPVELNKASQKHVRKLLRQLLKDSSIPHAHSWEAALMPILLKAAVEVDPDVQNGDDMDIRHYVKLKKIPGGRPGDTVYVSGLVFSKNLALKSMARSIPRPNILIITFPLEYARHQQHFMSLEPVIRQEREFLENLVSRIAALRPNLLLVEKHVSGLALEFLEKAKIATAQNVKPSVIEAVSRCTQTRIITSMDKLVTTPMHSECGSFDVKTYVYEGRRKTYMYISGCPKELGCTIVLRGENNDVLLKVKRITEFMIYVVYSLRLETYLMRDEFAQIPSSLDLTSKPKGTDPQQTETSTSAAGIEQSNGSSPLDSQKYSIENLPDGSSTDATTSIVEETEVPEDVPEPTYCEDMVKKHETKILSASPLVKFEPPYLLMRAREMERRLAYLKRLRNESVDDDRSVDEKAKAQKFFLITPEMIHEPPSNAPPQVKEVLHAVREAEYDRALHHYQTQKRQWEAYLTGNSDLFDPYAHQNIVVLFSLVCTATSIPCSGPDVFAIEFYNEHGGDRLFEPDCTLGQYIEDLCHNANAICTANGCERRMFEHHRQYVHGEAQISVFLQPYPSKLPGYQDTILMWSCCKICGNETQIMPVSDNTWRYSFGKYLELSFWGRNLHARAGVCPHDLQRDHLHYFGYKDLALRIQYDPITLLEIIVPRTRITWKVENDLKYRNDVYSTMELRLNRFMASVKARLKGMNVESVVPELAETCKKEVETLIKKASDDHASLIKQLQDKYANSHYWEVTTLNEVLRSVQEKVVEWDTAFADFEKDFFLSEKDIKRLATLQLKKIFLDKDASVTSVTSTDDHATTPTDAEQDDSVEATAKPRPLRRMTLSPEKAQDVLVSVVEEHSSKKGRETAEEEYATPLPSPKLQKSAVPTPNSIGDFAPEISPTQLETVSQQEVKHLDLAVPSSQSEQHQSGLSSPSGNSGHFPFLGSAALEYRGTPSPTPFEQNETFDSANRSGADPSGPPAKTGRSSIPRLAEGAFRRSGKATSPPLLRSQSQPVPVQGEKEFNGSILGTLREAGDPAVPDSGLNTPLGSKSKHGDRKLSDRLGFSSLKSGRLSAGHSLIPRSVPSKKDTSGVSRVSSLAKHFEQLSREFEKERQRERQRRAARAEHSRAYPRASSKPIVEVFKNVREAVEEREPPGDGEDFISSAPHDPPQDPARTSDALHTMDLEKFDDESKPDRATIDSVEPDTARNASQVGTDAEADDGPSDDDRTSADELHTIDSHEDGRDSLEDESMDLKDLPKHERSTLLKMLTNFWSERSASGWAPLDYPLQTSDHVFADCDVIVREDEPSSLVAFALDSVDYKEKLASIREHHEGNREFKSESGPGVNAIDEARVEHALLRATGTHLKYQFQEGQAKMLCKVFYAEQFDALRTKCGIADRIVESLSRCAKWDSRGGKTKSLFLKTLDDRFILKSLSPIETQAFLRFAPAYFQIMSEALFHELPSAIAKMFGFYQVIIKNPATGTEFNWYLLLMENLFYDRAPTRIFDLKGSMRNRKVQSTGERNEVLLDENMVDFIYETPLFAREHSKKLLSQSVWNDTLFLGRQNVMDYSLMIAIDEPRRELVVGIIDCIRTYTWDKKLESWIKDRGFAGGGKNRPTVTSPKEYKSRFREAMARYVLQAPSCWHQFQPNHMYRYPRVENHIDHVASAADVDSVDGSVEV